MSDLREFAKRWVTDNICDGEDRSKTGRADKHNLNSPDIYEMVDDLCESYQDINGWISVDDRLPDLRERVLLFDNGGFGALSGRRGIAGWYVEGDLDKDSNITHWMPLPEPPKQ